MTKVLKKMPYANAHVRIDKDGSITLVSYVTDVVKIDKDGWIEVTGLYSMTTRRHISCFMDEYTDRDYYFAKNLLEKGIRYNLKIGDVMKVA